MSIKELIEKVGVENVQCQWIHECFVAGNYNRKQGGTDLTIATDQISAKDLMDGDMAKWKRGIIIWFDAEKLK